jgi:hypothetical protein
MIKPSDADAIIAIVNQLNNGNKIKRTVIISDVCYDAMQPSDKMMLSCSDIELIKETKSEIKLKDNDKILVLATLQENAMPKYQNPPPPPSPQEPRVIKEGEQPKKPTLDEIGDRIRMSKNYRIAEKDGVFWIEELKIEHYKILGRYIPVKEKWIIIDTTIYRSLQQCKSHLNIIIESKLTIKNTETKYHYL